LATDYKIKKYGSVEDIFILCETCHWCALHILKIQITYREMSYLLKRHGNVKLSYLPNESFTFNYNDKHGVELEFRPRKKKKQEE
jgi:hypothetical protein